jgi:gentisate 1,2-dioxygenase
VKYEWEAGDIVVVHNNCVHQHSNRSQTKPARTLVMKTKPMYMFMNMLFQKRLKDSPKEPTPGGVGYVPRKDSTA